jgi:hypothetical protein
VKTSFKLLRPEDVWQPKMGAPRGNRNALKIGAHTKEARSMRKQVTSVRRTMKLLIEAAKEELAMH